MGTSVSKRSPDTHNWRAVAASYLADNVPIDRINQEIWRAATNQESGNLPLSLAEPLIARCLNIISTSESLAGALHEISRIIALSGEQNLATDIARRAAIICFQQPAERKLNFVKSLFAETVDYLVSRDLPGYVGQAARIRDISSSIEFKDSIKKRVEEVIEKSPMPMDVAVTSENWKSYIESQIRILANK